ncbi:prepilin-type N-terminal cleavage/methylation domain-containing protein [Planctomycetota bacterium]
MQTIKQTRRYKHGFTLIELILAVGLLSVIGTATVGLIRQSSDDFLYGSRRSHLLQEGRAALAKMVQTLRQAQEISSVSGPSDSAGSITFDDNDSTEHQFQLDSGSDELDYGATGSLSALTDSVTSLTFTCYDVDGATLAAPVTVADIRSMKIDATLTDMTDSSISFDLSTRMYWPLDGIQIVVNEFMYHPTGNPEAPYEWVELYNIAEDEVDLNNWTFWTGSASTADTLTAHAQYGNGSTTISGQGYALIVTDEAELFNEQVVNGDFETVNLNDWDTTTNWSSSKYNTHSGSRKIESTVDGTASLMQEITLPSGMSSYTFGSWEMTSAILSNTSLIVTVRNTSDVVLETVYSGTFNSTWTYHTLDMGAYAGQTIRIHFEATKAGASGSLLLDDVSVSCSNVPTGIPVLSVVDGKLGNGMGNNGDTLAITNGTSTVDSVTYDNNWGGDGDDRTLERISATGASSDSSNWEVGPVNGTPGAAN